MKKKIIYIAAIIICLSIITGGTYAYYTASDTARNVITSGGVEIKLVEQQLVNGELKPYPNQPIKILPSVTVSKIVRIESLEQSVWVRAACVFTVYDTDGKKMDIPEHELKQVILIESGSADWKFKDGWWYYDTAIKSGEATEPLFETVSFSGPNMGNKYQNCTVKIDVIAQAVQKANNGTTVMEALGWPES